MEDLSSALAIPEPEPIYARTPGEPAKAWEAFKVYRDMRSVDRSLRGAAELVGKGPTLLFRWSAEHNWVARANAWDAECDRIARQARLDEIDRINRRHADIAEIMLDAVEKNMPAIERGLARSPRTAVEMFAAAVKAQRDAAGIQDPAKRTVIQGDPDNPIQHDVDIAGIMAHLDPATVLKARDLAIEVAKAQAREQAGLPPAPPKEEPTTEG